jgi:hypothetical protein
VITREERSRTDFAGVNRKQLRCLDGRSCELAEKRARDNQSREECVQESHRSGFSLSPIYSGYYLDIIKSDVIPFRTQPKYSARMIVIICR